MNDLTTIISIHDYLLSDCKLAQPSPIVLMEIYRMTNGDPCKDCGYAPECSVKKVFELKKMHKNSGFKTGIGETNADGRGYKDIYESVKEDLISFGSGLRLE